MPQLPIQLSRPHVYSNKWVEREAAFIDAFIVPAKRDRYKLLLGNPLKRRKIPDLLNHNLDFIGAFAERAPDGYDQKRLQPRHFSGKAS